MAKIPDEFEIAKAVRALARQKPQMDLVETADSMAQNVSDTERMVEALLFANPHPLKANEILAILGENHDVGTALARLKRLYTGRGVNLIEVAGGWRFQTSPDLAHMLEDKKEEPKKLSRAALETLSIIAYHQPCTRAEIEDIRGVSLSRGTLDLLMEIKWVRPGARRRSPGKPLTYRTTADFLAQFNLSSLDDLPGKSELQAQGLLSANLPKDFEVPRPSQNIDQENDFEFDETSEINQEFVRDFFD